MILWNKHKELIVKFACLEWKPLESKVCHLDKMSKFIVLYYYIVYFWNATIHLEELKPVWCY